MKYPTVTMKTSNGVIKIELYPDIAPNTVNNFISLIEKGFYNGTLFHRIIPKFMIQGGDPLGNGTGGPGYSIRGEFTSNRFQNDLKHTRGVISMARTVDPNSAGSQFFIMVEDSPYLDGEYASFGRVISGMEEVDRIVNVPRDYDDKPLEDEVIESVAVETFGETYEHPKTV
ncbi:Peptidyl-prolyl cis-trans isomerase B [Caprobacter fermentans]|uniref:Peptidyl-prolyl cis-trans isomerase n=1 Tax=Caproicibacter fermentans TaxID=2576756 RepID=A0A6N8HX44_9FIRM|nr:peptidylprolyl isomerase [Caproicibacter fermentans]MVB10312.1 Peptidyl-prolyl cis-trans isomerase B [Caproicibacter fermentans]OCN02893.1 peptidylprolyl isomerase [Clostridium sp. W14A]